MIHRHWHDPLATLQVQVLFVVACVRVWPLQKDSVEDLKAKVQALNTASMKIGETLAGSARASGDSSSSSSSSSSGGADSSSSSSGDKPGDKK